MLKTNPEAKIDRVFGLGDAIPDGGRQFAVTVGAYSYKDHTGKIGGVGIGLGVGVCGGDGLGVMWGVGEGVWVCVGVNGGGEGVGGMVGPNVGVGGMVGGGVGPGVAVGCGRMYMLSILCEVGIGFGRKITVLVSPCWIMRC